MSSWNGSSAVIAVTAIALLACQEPQWRPENTDSDAGRKAWNEIEARIPPYPRNENLVPFEAGGASLHRFYIDAPSLSIGEDGVVRYTLVVKTAGGATNVSFEGLRCDGRRQKVYAVGEANGRWTPARNPQWRRIEYDDVNRHHLVLHDDFFCWGRNPRKSEKEVLQLLKYGPPEYRF